MGQARARVELGDWDDASQYFTTALKILPGELGPAYGRAPEAGEGR
jgi:hypothetical protein